MKRCLSFFILLIHSTHTYSQDTVKYIGTINNLIIYESIELYSDSTFKWTSEYDLSWSEYGQYQIINDSLILSYDVVSQPQKVEIYEIENEFLYRLDEKNRRIIRKKDKSIRSKWSWLNGFKHKYVIKKVAN
ncbi:hypothetical protein AVL50_31705 [Flammeovirga sp. SJP92]|nr:hypothetical protein AVL50_31705 [Flammeovirga sp. SJP92]